jgi:hypothetical protein
VLDPVVIDNTDDEVVVTIAAPVVAAVADKVLAITETAYLSSALSLSSPISNSQSSLYTEGASNEAATTVPLLRTHKLLTKAI